MSHEYSDLVTKCAEDGKREMMAMASIGAIEPLSLYFIESQKGKSGALILQRKDKHVGPGMKLACEEALHGGVPYEHYYQWVRNRSQSAPILAT